MKKRLLTILLMAANTVALANNLGQTTYQIACQNCHAPKLAKAMKAPAAFDKKAWDERFKQARLEVKDNPQRFKTPMDYLLYRVTIGKGLMQHGGLCKEASVPNKNCSNEALTQAILYMSGN